MKIILVGLMALVPAFALPLSAVAQTSEQCAAVSKPEIEHLFDRWNDSLQTHDPAKVAANYAPDAVLLPTVSNRPRADPAAIKDYFTHFLESSPKGRIDTRTVVLGCNTAIDAGTYTFTLTGKDGKVVQVPARYTYVYAFRNGEWLIQHHHSSAMPELVEGAH